MTHFALDMLSVATPTAIITTLLFGMMIGAFYGYDLEGTLPPRYPFQFWLVGLAFVAVLAALGVSGRAEVSLPHSLGRAVLWTFLCGAIPIGRWLRMTYHVWRLKRKHRP